MSTFILLAVITFIMSGLAATICASAAVEDMPTPYDTRMLLGLLLINAVFIASIGTVLYSLFERHFV